MTNYAEKTLSAIAYLCGQTATTKEIIDKSKKSPVVEFFNGGRGN
jgi:hypothetical protein